MKKFQFSLESVMNYKDQLLTGLQNDLARVTKALEQAEQDEINLQLKYQQNQQCLNDQMGHGIAPQMIGYYTNYASKLEKEIKVVERKRNVLKREQNACLDKLRKMNMEVITLEKLKDKEQEAYKVVVAKAEERLVEEFVGYGRSTGSASSGF